MKKFIISVFLVFVTAHTVIANEKEDLTVLKNTVVNLMKTLVDQGVMSREQAELLIKNAQDKAAQEAEQLVNQKKELDEDKSAVRVQYVPDFVKDEIRAQVRQELKQQVVKDVISHANRERWGVKDSLPRWLSKIKISGDMRVRGQGDYYGSGNEEGVYLDTVAINDRGATLASPGGAVSTDNLNTVEDRELYRIRARLNLDAKINDQWKAGLRLATGNTRNPVSTNQTLGNSGGQYEFNLDRAYLRYQDEDEEGYDRLSFWAGRIPNPWYSTNLVWDDDLSFEGISSTYQYNFTEGSGILYDKPNNVFFTFGVFPLQEFELSSQDQWLLGTQLGGSFYFANQSRISAGVAYYNYQNVKATVNPRDIDEFESLAPEFTQNGNTITGVLTPLFPADDAIILGYASDYNLLNITSELELSIFAPYRLLLSADYVKNIGYDSSEVSERIIGIDDVSSEDMGYQIQVDFGWPRVANYGQWSLYAGYKHLERDAVFAAFTDSDFHGGGTDTKGWYVGGAFGIAENTWISAKWISTEEIEGPSDLDCNVVDCSYDLDTLQINLEAKY